MSNTRAYCQQCDFEELFDDYGKAKDTAIGHYYDTEHRARVEEVKE